MHVLSWEFFLSNNSDYAKQINRYNSDLEYLRCIIPHADIIVEILTSSDFVKMSAAGSYEVQVFITVSTKAR
jgi:hypothetical protein